MKEAILNKIEKIKKKPEHIRRRYAIICTAISMVFVLIVWAISIRVQTSTMSQTNINQDQLDVLNELGTQKKSLEDTANSIKDMTNQIPESSNSPQIEMPDGQTPKPTDNPQKNIPNEQNPSSNNSQEGFGQ